MSLLEKIKSMFSGGSDNADAHAGHDQSGDDHDHEHGHDHSHDPVPAPNPLAEDESTPA
jgi:hypothetical protein